jgi:hypothetical protein
VKENVSLDINWKDVKKTIKFPFRIVFIDFGYACEGGVQDVRHNSLLPPIDPCPKDGRDVYQILASIWSSKGLRGILKNTIWGNWIKQKLESANPKPSTEFIENALDLLWLRTCTDDPSFNAPLCAPWKIIEDCFKILEDE